MWGHRPDSASRHHESAVSFSCVDLQALTGVHSIDLRDMGEQAVLEGRT